MVCRFNVRPDLWAVDHDRNQLGQVINNIVLNAQQAMPMGGTIDVSAINIALTSEQSPGKVLPLKEGNYVRIAVTDQGTGIQAELLNRIFDPFFSTKQHGSGLGLATSFSIAHNQGDTDQVVVKVESMPDITVFAKTLTVISGDDHNGLFQ